MVLSIVNSITCNYITITNEVGDHAPSGQVNTENRIIISISTFWLPFEWTRPNWETAKVARTPRADYIERPVDWIQWSCIRWFLCNDQRTTAHWIVLNANKIDPTTKAVGSGLHNDSLQFGSFVFCATQYARLRLHFGSWTILVHTVFSLCVGNDEMLLNYACTLSKHLANSEKSANGDRRTILIFS